MEFNNLKKEKLFKRMRKGGLTTKQRIDDFLLLDTLNPTPEEYVLFYSLWSKNYDEDMKYYPFDESHIKVAKLLNELFKDNKELSIIDVGAGTGEGGKNIFNFGFKNIDALDGSEGMLEIAKKKNIYKNLFCEMIANDGSELKTVINKYDVVISSGSFYALHLEGCHLASVATLAKKDGLLIISSFEDDVIRIREAIRNLNDSKTIEVLKEIYIPKLNEEIDFYCDGTLWVLRKL